MLVRMYRIWLLLSIFVAFGSTEFVDGSNVASASESAPRYLADAQKHKVESAEQYRKEELDGFLKTGKLPAVGNEALHLSKKDPVQRNMGTKVPKVSTDDLMKQYLDGGKSIKNHLNATSRGRGSDADTTKSPMKAPSHGKGSGKSPPPAHPPTSGVGKKISPPSKAPKTVKKKPKKEKDTKRGGKKKKGEKHKGPDDPYASDIPSSSPVPTMPPVYSKKGHVASSPSLGGVDVVLPPGYDTGVNGRSFSGPSGDTGKPQPSSSSNSSTVTKVVSPLAAFAGLLLIGGILISRRRRSEGNLDGNENLMKHTREGFDVENGTVSGNTYRTGAFTEDDGTLEGSVDASESNRNPGMSQKLRNEMEHVIKDLEDVSLGDDGASTTSVATGHTFNSYDGRLIDAVRASMTADAFKPDKSKVYDTSIKPEWASRSKIASEAETSQFETETPTPIVGPELGVAPESSLDDASVKSFSYKKFISSPPPEDSNELKDESLSTIGGPTLTKTVDVSNENMNETPSWMKAQLRPISNAYVTKSPSENLVSSDDTEPEWMKKFKQMGLEKKE